MSVRQIRPSRLEDVPALLDLARRSWLSAFAALAPLSLIDWWMRHQDRTTKWYEQYWPEMMVLEQGGTVLGLVQPMASEINGLWIHPRYQAMGVGTSLLRAGEEMIRRAGHSQVWLTCSGFNSGALEFYRRRSYTEVGRESKLHESGVECEWIRFERTL